MDALPVAELSSEHTTVVPIEVQDNHEGNIKGECNGPLVIAVIEVKDIEPVQTVDEKHFLSKFHVFIRLIRSAPTTALLSLPWALKQSGHWASIVFYILIALIFLCGANKQKNAVHQLSHLYLKQKISPMKTIQYAFLSGPKCVKRFCNVARIITYVFVWLIETGRGDVFLLSGAIVMNDLIKHYFDYSLQLDICILANMAVIFPITFLSYNTKSVLCFIGNCVVGSIIFLVVYYMCFYKYISKTHETITHNWSYFVGILIFNLYSIRNVFNLESHLKHNDEYSTSYKSTINIGVLFVISMQATMCLVGYLKYGEDTFYNILFNLPKDDKIVKISMVIYFISNIMICSFQFHFPINDVWDELQNHLSKNIKWKILTHTFVIILNGLFIMVFNRIEAIVNFIGTVLISPLIVILPAIVDMVIFNKSENNSNYYDLSINIVMIISGVFLMGLGCYTIIRF